MLFTFGYSPSYDPYIQQQKDTENPAKKIGFREKYEYPDGTIDVYHGGAIWKTPEEAYAYIDYLFDNPDLSDRETLREDWSVYVLDGDFDEDTFFIDGEMFHRLKYDRKIVRKVLRQTSDILTI